MTFALKKRTMVVVRASTNREMALFVVVVWKTYVVRNVFVTSTKSSLFSDLSRPDWPALSWWNSLFAMFVVTVVFTASSFTMGSRSLLFVVMHFVAQRYMLSVQV